MLIDEPEQIIARMKSEKNYIFTRSFEKGWNDAKGFHVFFFRYGKCHLVRDGFGCLLNSHFQFNKREIKLC